jgi:hypothetical protein
VVKAIRCFFFLEGIKMSRPYITTPTGNETSMPYEIGIAANLVQGQTRLAGLGYNPSVTTSGTSDIWSGTGLYPFQTSAQSLEILSSSANDTAAGTGARTVTMTLLDANYNQVTQTVTLNGTSVVAIPGGPYLRVNSLQVATAGSGYTNAGTITLRVASAGATQGVILIGTSIAQSSVYTVPTGYTLFINKIVYVINAAASVSNYVTIATVIQNPNGSPSNLLATQRFLITNSGTGPFELDVPFPLVITQTQDFTLRETAISGTLAITALWQGVLILNTSIV